jgi:hypothetical protein
MSLNFFRPSSSWSFIVAACVLVMAPRPAAPQSPDSVAARARRIAAVVATAGREYGLGVASGALVSQAEVGEARELLAEARRLADSLPPDVGRTTRAGLDSLDAQVTALADPAAVRAVVTGLRTALAEDWASSSIRSRCLPRHSRVVRRSMRASVPCAMDGQGRATAWRVVA